MKLTKRFKKKIVVKNNGVSLCSNIGLFFMLLPQSLRRCQIEKCSKITISLKLLWFVWQKYIKKVLNMTNTMLESHKIFGSLLFLQMSQNLICFDLMACALYGERKVQHHKKQFKSECKKWWWLRYGMGFNWVLVMLEFSVYQIYKGENDVFNKHYKKKFSKNNSKV